MSVTANSSKDALTGQATGVSKGSTFSFLELQIMHGLGLDLQAEEYLKSRGGDSKAYQAIKDEVINTGTSSLETARNAGGKVTSTQSLSTLLKAMHINNNL